ncbi:hypothetical protein OG948_23475 [Embleya sp. NBC_00888]|nr:hypothetical protein OG948_23475 [Embleya sp. NBC_00888]
MHLAEALIALGGAFLAAGILARTGARIGLPTIPLFMPAGILFGPNTPGIALVDNPADLQLLGAIGLVFLLLNGVAGVAAARICELDRSQASNVVFTILSRGEFALVLAALAAGAGGLDARLAPFIAGYVLVMAVLGPLAATHSRVFERALPARLFRAREGAVGERVG